jgi:hypothetical protein
MGKVDKFQNAIHHGVPQGYQGIDASQGQAIHQMLKEFGNSHDALSFIRKLVGTIT